MMLCLMSRYQANIMLIGLKTQFDSTSYYVCILWDNVYKNHIFVRIVVRLCKFLAIFFVALVSFFATTSPYNTMDYMYRGDLRLGLLEIWLKKFWNHLNNSLCLDVFSKNYFTMFIHRSVTILYDILHEFWFITCALQWFSIFVCF